MFRGKRAVSQTTSMSSPVGGLNARDALALMPPTDAVLMTNCFPTPTNVQLRNGYTNWATGLPANVESIMPYTSSSTAKLFAASGTSFYDVTAQGAVGAPVVTGLSNARWQHQNFGTTGNQFLFCVNGADSMRLYNGSVWQTVTDVSAPIAITGVSTSSLIEINEYRNRLFFVEKNSFNVWYLPVNSAGGAAAKIDLSPIFKLGGYLMTMATWTIDNASGVNEYAVFISSEGEVVNYFGTDPSVADNFTIVGKFRIGRPVGRRCFVRVGSDIILICADGFIPLSKALLTDRSQSQDALSNKIVNLVNNDVQLYSANFGWEGCLHPIGNKLIVNVPQNQGSVQYQYVMNTITGAWCKFTNWNANCFATMQDSLYFGGNAGSTANSGYVAKADVGVSDNGALIFGECKTAFNYFGSPGQLKRFTMARLIFLTSGTPIAGLNMDLDFGDGFPVATPSFSGTAGTAWNVGAWNTFPWGSIPAIQKNWQGITGVGYCGAIHMRIASNTAGISWQSTDVVHETGGTL